ncbi:MAG: DUF1700 domain-containing protein [Clostridiales bacterium]|jgi:uncharacterized membrane protein|nr:DUF1700 domain-containing protein [Clostridiales bacterium]
MNKLQFLDELEKRLSKLSDIERKKSLGYYAEMIDDRIEDGMSEEEAVEALGNIDEIVKTILLDTSFPTLVKAKIKRKPGSKIYHDLLIILGFPFWFPILVSLLLLALSVYILIWTCIITLWTTVASLILGGLFATVFSCYQFPSNLASGLFFFGSSVCCIGLGIFAFWGTKFLSKKLVQATVLFTYFIKSLLIKKKEGEINEKSY